MRPLYGPGTDADNGTAGAKRFPSQSIGALLPVPEQLRRLSNRKGHHAGGVRSGS
jgi:hypothetical protein